MEAHRHEKYIERKGRGLYFYSVNQLSVNQLPLLEYLALKFSANFSV